jgi:hypothetical protein
VPWLIARGGVGCGRRILARHKKWVRETKSRGKPEECDGQKKDFPESEGMDAD